MVVPAGRMSLQRLYRQLLVSLRVQALRQNGVTLVTHANVRERERERESEQELELEFGRGCCWFGFVRATRDCRAHDLESMELAAESSQSDHDRYASSRSHHALPSVLSSERLAAEAFALSKKRIIAKQ